LIVAASVGKLAAGCGSHVNTASSALAAH
jgi:hypothetical protein